MALYEFLAGPGLGISLTVFILGMIWHVLWYIRGLDWKLDRVAYTAHFSRGIRGALQSIYRWLIPYGTRSWRRSPFFTLFFFLFHFGVVLVPPFLAGHTVLLKHTLGIALPTIPQALATTLTAGALLGATGIILRRLCLPEVRILNTPADWGILVLTITPLLTGFLCVHEVPGYQFWLLAHLISGNLLLVLAPFTRLSHIVLHFMSRAQLGMDYSIKRGGEFRGTSFPW